MNRVSIIIALASISMVHAVGPCSIAYQHNTASYPNADSYCEIKRDGGATEKYFGFQEEGCTPRSFQVGYFEDEIYMNDCWYARGDPFIYDSEGTCAGGTVLEYKKTRVLDLCRRPECPHPDAVNCEEPEPEVARAVENTDFLPWILGGILLLNAVLVLALFSSRSSIEKPAVYPQFSVAHREKVVASMAPRSGAPMGNSVGKVGNEESALTSAPEGLPFSASEVGPVSSRTRVGIVAAVCLIVTLGHIPLALGYGGWMLFLPIVAAVGWASATVFGVQAFLGQNSFTNWRKAVVISAGVSTFINVVGFTFFYLGLNAARDVCLAGCSNVADDPVYYAPCAATCGSMGVLLAPAIVNIVLLSIAFYVLFRETKRAEEGNGKVMSFGMVFPTQTGFKEVAAPSRGSRGSARRPPGGPGGSQGSRGSRRSKRGSARKAPE